MAPVILRMMKVPKDFKAIVCSTGQHREMLDQVWRTFSIKPSYDLKIMSLNQSLAQVTSRILEGFDQIILMEKPDIVLVQGDTTTAFTAALAAFYRRVAVAHVEAGLRTGNMFNPFPEELNRVLIDRVSQIYFAPTPFNKRTLINEGVASDKIHVTGNTGIDAFLHIRDRVAKQGISDFRRFWNANVETALNEKMILITAHRRESFGVRINELFSAIARVANKATEWHFVYPVHLNPNVRDSAARTLSGLPNVHLIDPLPYEPFVYLMHKASLIVTDSGGIQEEAMSLDKPVIVMRDTTERQEAMRSGTVILAGTGPSLEAALQRSMTQRQDRFQNSRRKNPFGDGKASQRILKILKEGRYL